jgi:hypothetical protein
MSVTHDFHPAWHAQKNNSVDIFGGLSNNPSTAGAFFAFIYGTPASGSASVSSALATETANNDTNSYGSGRLLATSKIWTVVTPVAVIPAGASVIATRS